MPAAPLTAIYGPTRPTKARHHLSEYVPGTHAGPQKGEKGEKPLVILALVNRPSELGEVRAVLSFTRAAGGLRLAAACCPSPCVSVCLSVVHSYCAWGYLGV